MLVQGQVIQPIELGLWNGRWAPDPPMSVAGLSNSSPPAPRGLVLVPEWWQELRQRKNCLCAADWLELRFTRPATHASAVGIALLVGT